ncbi:transcription factor GTE6 isoform X2 [Syzygium oleosum]|nr:transcription factor GTE6 isoform X2 [Syzygium oleosum]XP_056176205.1 transcription factor GTE6 isoform X2 [Syzygium oleosum]
MASIDPKEGNKEGPDVFGFYSRGVAEWLCGEDDFLPFAEPGEVADKDAGTSGCDGIKGDGFSTSSALFDDGLAPGFSDTRRERLKSFLRRAAFELSLEVDKMHEPVLKLHQLQTRLRSSRQQPTCSAASSDGDVGEHPPKKIKISSSSSSASISGHENPVRLQPSDDGSAGKNTRLKFSQMDLVEKPKDSAVETRSAPCQSPQMSKSLYNNYRSKSEGATAPLLGSNEAANNDDRDVNADLQFLLRSDHSRLDQMLKKYTDEHSSKLEYMGKQLEELLDTAVSKCRSMTRREKIQLQKLIQNLPQDNLERVVGILGRSDSSKTNLHDDITVDLEKEDNGTLWRLYYYVRAVEKARKLSAIQDTQIDSNAKEM